jgi:hypothetical protein
MDAYDVKRLALILAEQAEIEAMKADNMIRQAKLECPYWDGIHFIYRAEQLREIANKHNEQL